VIPAPHKIVGHRWKLSSPQSFRILLTLLTYLPVGKGAKNAKKILFKKTLRSLRLCGEYIQFYLAGMTHQGVPYV